ncbi:hypothetical protein [Bordetella sp. N]|uniref:hypothetical protein n=1 Tax=Bordetella sp. N TaxID=1746199 RepID=UPI0012E39430|nr:hypothetical protein [Bordetella sp. N]
MPIRESTRSSAYWAGVLALFAVFCLIVSVRWWLIGRYGSSVPFWDQWDAEAAILYPSYVSGHLTWATLLSAHNEHRILTTRLLALGLFALNGNWNPVLEMTANAVVLATALVLLTAFLTRTLGLGARVAFSVFLMALYAVPYASENTLAGFQGQFYFNLLFSFLSLWLLVSRPALSGGWWWGVLASIAAYFSLASGVFAAAAAVPVVILQAMVAVVQSRRVVAPASARMEVRPDPRLLPRVAAVGLLIGLVVICYVSTPQMAGHSDLKAHSITEFIAALVTELSWPRPVHLRHAILMNLPVLMFVVMLYRRRALTIAPATWFLLALAMWVLGQMTALAYGRASTVLAPRYLDLLSVGILLNFSCFLWCARSLNVGLKRATYFLCIAWVCYVAVGFYHARHEIGEAVLGKQHDSLVQQSNVAGYLATGDRGYLYDKPRMDIPYPDPGRLQMLLDDPGIRKILPSALLPSSAPDHRPGHFDDLVIWMLKHAWIAAALGALSLACAGMLIVKSRTSPVSGQLVQEVQ